MAERLIIAALLGLASAVIVWTVSTVGHFPRVWPGTIFAFVSAAATWLIFLWARRG